MNDTANRIVVFNSSNALRQTCPLSRRNSSLVETRAHVQERGIDVNERSITASSSAASTISTAAAISTTTGTATAATSGTRLTGLRFIHRQSPALEFLVVEGINGGLPGSRRAHLNKTEAAASARFPVLDDLSRLDLAEFREQLLEVGPARLERQIADV